MSYAATELRKALAEVSRVAFENAHPHIPYDLSIEEAERGSVVKGRFCLNPVDLASRVQGRAA